jgi:prepilin-type N-terminal cleavage/methylation domain-containing protein
MKKQKKQDGFSLVELIVAIAIMAIIVLPLLRAFVVSARTNAKAKERLRATEASQNIMESIEAMSLDHLLTYFSDSSPAMFGESSRTRLYIDSDGKYQPTSSTEKSTDGNYYFGLKGVNGKDILLTLEANDSTIDDVGTTLNNQEVAKVTAISSDNDAICSMSTMPETLMWYIDAQDPEDDVYQENVTRHIEITIEDVTDSSGDTYTKVTTNHYYTWWGGTYPATSTDGDFSDVVFDNSGDVSRQLKNVYLFFYPWYTSTTGNLTDYITINNTTKRDVKVFLVKQKFDVSASEYTGYQIKDSNYRVEVNVVETMSGGSTVASTKLRTNLDTNLFSESGSAQAFIALNGVILSGVDANKVSHDNLLVKEKDDRLYDVTVATYQSGSYDTINKKYFSEPSKYYMEITGGMAN